MKSFAEQTIDDAMERFCEHLRKHGVDGAFVAFTVADDGEKDVCILHTNQENAEHIKVLIREAFKTCQRLERGVSKMESLIELPAKTGGWN